MGGGHEANIAAAAVHCCRIELVIVIFHNLQINYCLANAIMSTHIHKGPKFKQQGERLNLLKV